MKRNVNKIAIIISLSSAVVGLIFILIDVYEKAIMTNIGCSLIASGGVLLFTSIFIDASKIYPVWDVWGLEKIFKTRAEKNIESDPMLETHHVKQLDGIAFGLKSFRSNRRQDILNCLTNGMHMRLLVMDPNGQFIGQREIEENVSAGSMTKSIEDLVEWANKLNTDSGNGKIEVRYYNAMTLDFYWRIDDSLYIGPYMYDVESQQTITYKFKKGKKGFQLYTDYFEKLWTDAKLSKSPELQ